MAASTSTYRPTGEERTQKLKKRLTVSMNSGPCKTTDLKILNISIVFEPFTIYTFRWCVGYQFVCIKIKIKSFFLHDTMRNKQKGPFFAWRIYSTFPNIMIDFIKCQGQYYFQEYDAMAQSEIENADQCDNSFNGASNSAGWIRLLYNSNSFPDVSSMDFTTFISGAFTGTTYNTSTNACSSSGQQCDIYRQVRSEKKT